MCVATRWRKLAPLVQKLTASPSRRCWGARSRGSCSAARLLRCSAASSTVRACVRDARSCAPAAHPAGLPPNASRTSNCSHGWLTLRPAAAGLQRRRRRSSRLATRSRASSSTMASTTSSRSTLPSAVRGVKLSCWVFPVLLHRADPGCRCPNILSSRALSRRRVWMRSSCTA
jgi:hypothetical protein